MFRFHGDLLHEIDEISLLAEIFSPTSWAERRTTGSRKTHPSGPAAQLCVLWFCQAVTIGSWIRQARRWKARSAAQMVFGMWWLCFAAQKRIAYDGIRFRNGICHVANGMNHEMTVPPVSRVIGQQVSGWEWRISLELVSTYWAVTGNISSLLSSCSQFPACLVSLQLHDASRTGQNRSASVRLWQENIPREDATIEWWLYNPINIGLYNHHSIAASLPYKMENKMENPDIQPVCNHRSLWKTHDPRWPFASYR